jgi:hypothetical protein
MSGNLSPEVGLAQRFSAEGISAPLGKSSKGKGKAVERPFGEDLIKAQSDQLFKRLDEVADKLFRFPSQRVLEEYKGVVRELLQQVQGMLQVRQEFSMTSGAAFRLITRVHEGLSQMEKVLSREAKRAKLMKLANDIKGCLVSLLA